ncbi:ABC transporter permease [Ancylomarina sp. YFZ004]
MFIHYLKSFVASVKKNRFFYLLNTIGFAMAFLLLTLIFTYVYQETSFDRFHKNSSHIYRLHSVGYGVTPLGFADQLKDKLPEIESMVRFSGGELSVVHNNKEIRVGKVEYTDPEVFDVFSFQLLSGNASTLLKAPNTIVISSSLSCKLFGDQSPLGKSLYAKNGKTFRVEGVMEDIPYNSHIQAQAFISLETLRGEGEEHDFNCGSWSSLSYLKLSYNAVISDVETKINAALEEFRMSDSEGKIPLELQPLNEICFDYANNKYDGSKHVNAQTVTLYFAIALLLIGIVVINYINLSTAIAGGRMKEIAIRKLNGASDSQILAQTLLEAIATALVSFGLALLFVEMLMPDLCKLLNIEISLVFNRSSLYLIYLIIIVLIGSLSGLIPGLFLSKLKEISVLKKETIFNSNGLQRKALLVFQLLIVACLLNASFIMKNQINYIFEKDLGYKYENIITFRLNKDLLAKKEVLKQALLKKPYVEGISFSTCLMGGDYSKSSMGNIDNKRMCYWTIIDPGYTDLYNIKLVEGRNFSWDRTADFSKTCMLNKAALLAFGIENIETDLFEGKEILAVVDDFNFTSLYSQVEPLVIYCGEDGAIAQLKFSGACNDDKLQEIESVMKAISPNSDFDYSLLEDRIKALYQSDLDLKNSIQFYSFITLVIALLGLFGLTLFLIRKKNKEICLRKLFGANFSDTSKLLSKEQIWIVLIANIMALPISYWFMGKWLTNFQFRQEIDFVVYIKTLMITLVLTLLAVLVLIVKTHRVNLIQALRHE